MKPALLALFLVASGAAAADTVVAARTIRAREIVGAGDLRVQPGEIPGAVDSLEAAIGLEARVAIYAGQPVRPGDLAPPALVERNQIVTLVYAAGGLTISTEGRALGRGALGARLRVMNLASRETVIGQVTGDARVHVPAHP